MCLVHFICLSDIKYHVNTNSSAMICTKTNQLVIKFVSKKGAMENTTGYTHLNFTPKHAIMLKAPFVNRTIKGHRENPFFSTFDISHETLLAPNNM